MIDLKNITSFRRQHASSLLGLSLDGSRLDGVVLRRTNGSLQLQQSFSVVLTLDPLTSAPELVGREIRNHLDAAEVRERRCVVALPLKWALTARTTLPALPEADVASFLQIEAERAFPCDVATLITATSRCKSPAGAEHAVLVGIPRTQIVHLEAALRAAQLRPENFSLGITSLQPADGNGVLALRIGDSHVGLQVTCGGGVVALRSLESAIETEGSHRAINAGQIAREVRITLGQLPEDLRQAVKEIRIFGPRDLALQLADEMQIRFESLNLKVEVVSSFPATGFGVQLPPNAPVSAAFSLAAEKLAGREPQFDFLPPRISAWQQVTSRYATGKLRKVGAVAAAAVLVVVAAFLFQQVQIWRLDSRWSKMSAKVTELEDMQQNIKQYRPWFDESVRSLSILRLLTTAFPEDGVVTAKTVEIRGANQVTCTGTARDYASLLGTLAKMRKSGNVADVKVDRVQGKSPMQFTFDFRWVEGGGHAN